MKKQTTLQFKGVELDIEYWHQPAEKAERGPEAQYPGCPEMVEIEEIKHKGTCMFELCEVYTEELEREILDQHVEN